MILVTLETNTVHEEILYRVLQRPADWGIRLCKCKCKFMKIFVVYYEFVLTAEGIKVTDDKVEDLIQAPAPRDLQKVHSLCGLVSCYRSFFKKRYLLCCPFQMHLEGPKS